MKANVLIGIVLIVVGVLALAYGGFSYTRDKKVIDLGPVEAHTQTRERVALPPIIGIAALAAGAGLVVAGTRRAH
jgi:uncharacterized membrane protein YidH (DUF202 family)